MKKGFTNDFWKKLNDVQWNEKQKILVHEQMISSFAKQERKERLKRSVIYALSVAMLVAISVVGYNFIFQHELEFRPSDEGYRYYYGKTGEKADFQQIAMTDENVMYYIPVTVSKMSLDNLEKINFQFDEQFYNYTSSIYGLRMARNDIPLTRYELLDDHLRLYFSKDDLMNMRGSTGSGMGLFSIRTFAENFSDVAKYYTAYGDEEPFVHDGEGFEIIDVSLEPSSFFLPVSTEKGIFLGKYYDADQSLEEIFDQFFSLHQLPITEDEIDLSMFNLVEMVEDNNTISVYLTGDLEEASQKSKIDKASLERLIIDGVGINLRNKVGEEEGIIYLNNELLFNSSLSQIQINYLADIENE